MISIIRWLLEFNARCAGLKQPPAPGQVKVTELGSVWLTGFFSPLLMDDGALRILRLFQGASLRARAVFSKDDSQPLGPLS